MWKTFNCFYHFFFLHIGKFILEFITVYIQSLWKSIFFMAVALLDITYTIKKSYESPECE